MVHLLLIAAVASVVLGDSIGRVLAPLEPAWAAAATLAPMTALVLHAWARCTVAGRRADRRGDVRALVSGDRWCAFARLGSTGAFVAGVLGFGWLDAVRSVTGDLIAIDELLALVPLGMAIVGSWWAWYPLERRIREATMFAAIERGQPVHPVPARARFVWTCVRHQILFVLVPMAPILAWAEVVAVAFARSASDPSSVWARVLPSDFAGSTNAEWAAPLIQFGGVLLVMGIAPALLRHVWDTVPLGDGVLRDKLAGMCAEHRVRVAGLLVWRTGGAMLNGAVLGLFYPLRYILLTDALLDAMPEREVEAVAAHEIAHVRRRHMPWLAAGVGGALLGVGSGLSLLAADVLPEETLYGPGSAWVGGGIGVAALVAGFLMFGWVSRSFERQADAFAAQHLSRGEGSSTITDDAAWAMAGALQRVATLNHIPVRRFTWRHGSIAARQRRLKALVGVRIDRSPADRHAFRVKLVSLACAVAGAVLLGLDAASVGAA